MLAATVSIAVDAPRATAARVATLASLMLVLPLGAFALSLQPVPAAFVLTGLGLALLLILRDDATGAVLGAPLVGRDLAACFVAALALCVLGGQGHFT